MKEIITLNEKQFPDVDLYIAIDEEIKKLEKMKTQLKSQYLSLLSEIEYNPEAKYRVGLLEFTSRVEIELNQMATFHVIGDSEARLRLFPNAIQFKIGKNKLLAEEYGLITKGWSTPVCTIKKAET